MESSVSSHFVSEDLLSVWRAQHVASSAEEILRWALGQWGEHLVICTAFQVEGTVIIDLAHRIDPNVRVLTLDTGRLPAETYEIIEQVRKRYNIRVEIYAPDAAAVNELVSCDGPNLFYHSHEQRLDCCQVRKVEPLRRALSGRAAWITGLRRGQSAQRAEVERLAIDAPNGGLIKLCPLADWTWQQVWEYVDEHDVPYHPLYDQGYLSIGCEPCTRAVRPGTDARSGRWWWEQKEHRECGLHLPLVEEQSTTQEKRRAS